MEENNLTNVGGELPPEPEPAPAPQPAPPPAPEPPAAPSYGAAPPPPPPAGAPQGGFSFQTGAPEKQKVVAGVLAILLGSLGIHKFYMGYMTEGIILLAVTVVSFGTLSWISGIIGIIEGIIYLTKTDEDFQQTYVVNKKKWF